jgi:hypothetical protein
VSTLADREKIFTKYGTRWSELWRLPYWDPSRQLVVDAMSCGKKVITSRISGPDKYRRVVLVVRWGVFSPIVGI